MLDRIIRLLLIAISIYFVVITGMFIKFDIEHEMLNGIYVTLFLVVFTICIILLNFIYNKNYSKYFIFPVWISTVLGVTTFYQVFIKYSMTELSNEVLYGFDYYIYHTFFRAYEFQTFQTPYAISYLIFVGLLLIGSIIASKVIKEKII